MTQITFEPVEPEKTYNVTLEIDDQTLLVGLATPQGRVDGLRRFDNIPDALRAVAKLIDKESRRTKTQWNLRVEIDQVSKSGDPAT